MVAIWPDVDSTTPLKLFARQGDCCSEEGRGWVGCVVVQVDVLVVLVSSVGGSRVFGTVLGKVAWRAMVEFDEPSVVPKLPAARPVDILTR